MRRRIIPIIAAWLSILPPTPAFGQTASSKDAYGDPLPPGAIVRLGSVRWRTGPAYSTALGPDGKRLFVGGGGGAIRVFDIESGLLVRSYDGPEYEVRAIALSPDGKTLAGASYQGSFLFDVDSGKKLRQFKTGAVAVMAFSPDGTKLITGGEDHERSVRVIDVATGKEQLRFLWHQRRVSFVACSRDNKTLVTASGYDNDVRIADLNTGDLIHTFREKNAYDTVVALTADAKTLAVAERRYQNRKPQWSNTVRLIDVASGKQQMLVEQGEGLISTLLFSPDGKTLIAWGDKHCQEFDVASGRLTRDLPGCHARYFSPDSRALIGVGPVIRVWDFASGKELHPQDGPVSAANSIAISPDGVTLAMSSYEERENIHLWDSTTGKQKGLLKGHTSYVRGVQFAPDGRLISGGGDSTLRVWDVKDGAEVFQFKLHEPRAGEKPLQVTNFAVSRDGATLTTSAIGFEERFGKGEKMHLFAWNLKNGKLLAMSERDGHFFDWPGFSADGKAVVQRDGKDLVCADLITGKTRFKLEPTPQPGGEGVLNPNIIEAPFSASPDGRLLAARGNRQRNEGPRYWRDHYAIVVFDATTGKELHRIAVDDWLTGVVFSPDGRRIAGIDGRLARIWDAATGKRLWESAPLDFRTRVLAFSPDGARLATALDNATTLIWDVASTIGKEDGP
ncbi:MAG: hypothetical protein L0211_00450 [Planctomycetaceae bacterium]|nr:hypothetical protein [Planctomycetaceae bacterium]